MLVDTSVWIDHFRQYDGILARILEEQKIVMHPFVIGELALGNLRNRTQILNELAHMPLANLASDKEVHVLIERHNLAGSGIGFIDAHLLASASISGVSMWTRDKRLHHVAEKLGLAAAP